MEKQPAFPREFPGATWLGKEEEEAVLNVIRKQSPFRYYGPNFLSEAKQFEAEFARFIASTPGQPWPEESDYLITAVNSGTGALEIALEALGVGCGDEVCVQGFMWIATISAIVRNRAIPVLVDSDGTLNMDPGDLERKITDRTKVVIPVPMLGGCARIGEIMEVVRKANERRHARNLPSIKILEDNAQAIGAHAPGCQGSRSAGETGTFRIGTFGDAGIFSLQINKNITAGEGGIIVTRDRKLHERVQAIHNVGFVADKSQPGNWYGDVPLAWGQGRRITELQAAVARVQLRKLDSILSHMRASHRMIAGHVASRWDGKVKLREPAYPSSLGDTGYFLVFKVLAIEGMNDDEKVQFCRKLRQRMIDIGLPTPLYMHDFEVHVYYNIPQLLRKSDVNNGCPWNCPNNAFHGSIAYGRGSLPRLDAGLVASLGINVPSTLTSEQESSILKMIDEVFLETFK